MVKADRRHSGGWITQAVDHMLLVILLRFLDFLHLCMTFLDLAEGDKLAVVVVEL
jgi:hypothetical protein